MAVVLDIFFEHPHVDLCLAEGEAAGIVADHDADGASPISRANDADLFHHGDVVGTAGGDDVSRCGGRYEAHN